MRVFHPSRPDSCQRHCERSEAISRYSQRGIAEPAQSEAWGQPHFIRLPRNDRDVNDYSKAPE